MSLEIRNLSPSYLWNHFADLNAVPRASKKEAQVIQFMMEFGAKLGLETIKDHVGNIIVRKPATPDMKDRKMIVLQSHLDMVHQKNNDTNFDFDTQGIEMFVDGDWVKARGTTLGADNGIGVATIMAILASNDLSHPAIEALFTIDEETGMTGAMGLEAGLLKGEILLNLDTEEDDEIDIGCAGGVDVTATRSYQMEKIESSSHLGYRIDIQGLTGGHSGIDIHRGRGNANKMMTRLLFEQDVKFGMKLSTFKGGSLRNAIPRESSAVIAINNKSKESFLSDINQKIEAISKEYGSIEANLNITITEIECPIETMATSDQNTIIKAIYGAHNGVFRMSPDIADLVEASNNVAKVDIQDGIAKILCLTRSSVASSKWDVALSLKSVFELAGCDVVFSGDYPGWTPNVHSPILQVLSDTYEKMFDAKASVVACHAGLECGILRKNYPDMDMISYGPTIKGAHSPDERVNIKSVEKFWNFTIEILKNIPKAIP
ncbi:MAG: aminoacyl-histidine dipeptidase [Saprospiraceae bacterium]